MQNSTQNWIEIFQINPLWAMDGEDVKNSKYFHCQIFLQDPLLIKFPDFFLRSNVDNISDADIVLLSVADESKSTSKRRGASEGPHCIRIASNESEFFSRDGKLIPIMPMRGSLTDKKIYDFGYLNRDELYTSIYDIVTQDKIPVLNWWRSFSYYCCIEGGRRRVRKGRPHLL